VTLRGLGAAAELLPEGVFDGRRVELRPHLARCRRLLEGLAQALEAQRKYAEEQGVLTRVIALLRRETGDPDHPSTVRPLLVLGRVQAVVGDRAAALRSLALALAVADKHLGPLHLDIATCLDNLAEAMFEAQRFAEAEALFRRALTIRQQLLDPRGHAAALRTSENNVSMAIVARGKWAKRRALAPVPAAASRRSSSSSSGSLGVA
jgi:tetratricopeptide (TPR) repeat protein